MSNKNKLLPLQREGISKGFDSSLEGINKSFGALKKVIDLAKSKKQRDIEDALWVIYRDLGFDYGHLTIAQGLWKSLDEKLSND